MTIFDKRDAPAVVDGLPLAGAVGYALFLSYGRLGFQLGQAPLRAFNHSDFISVGPDLRDGVFHHVAVAVNRSSATGGALYVDGEVVLSFDPTSQSGDLSTTEPARIGNHATPNYDAFFGLIDEVSLYDQALSASAVQAIYQARSAGKCAPGAPVAGLAAPWDFNDNFPNGGFVGPDQASYVADTYNHVIRRVEIATGRVTTVAGTGAPGNLDGPADTAQFNTPLGTFVDGFGTVFVADTGNNVIRKISTDTPRNVATFAGSGQRGYVDGPRAVAQFDFPNDLVADAAGVLYVCEFNNHTIRKITPDGLVSTFVGNGTRGFADDVGIKTGLNQPAGLAIDKQGNLYVTEWGSQRVRKVTPAGQVTTLAGSVFPGLLDGQGVQARFNLPDGIAVDAAGGLFITEDGNHTVRHITTDGVVSTVAGTGLPGWRDGAAAQAQFNTPGGIGIDAGGNLIVADTHNHRIRLVQFLAAPTVVVQPGSRTIPLGSTTEFTAAVAGSGPDTFQWRFNGLDIPGATNSMLTLTNVQYAQAGAWAITKISDNGEYDPAHELVRWGPFFDSVSRALTYEVDAPAGLAFTLAFSGRASFDGMSETIGGAQSVGTSVCLRSLVILPSGELSLSLGEADAQSYVIETSADLERWSSLTTVSNVDGTLRFKDPAWGVATQRFYRAVRQP